MFGWRSKRTSDNPATTMPERYQGKPILIVLENYVLDCAGELAPDKRTLAANVVQRVFGGGADWKATIRDRLQLEDSVDEHIVRLWHQNQEIARRANRSVSATDFARMFVDANFVQYLR